MVVGAGAVEVEEAEVEGAELGGLQVGEAVRGGEVEVACGVTRAVVVRRRGRRRRG